MMDRCHRVKEEGLACCACIDWYYNFSCSCRRCFYTEGGEAVSPTTRETVLSRKRYCVFKTAAQQSFLSGKLDIEHPMPSACVRIDRSAPLCVAFFFSCVDSRNEHEPPSKDASS
jgi:hypothetical protein